jgi:hypothetical protein
MEWCSHQSIVRLFIVCARARIFSPSFAGSKKSKILARNSSAGPPIIGHTCGGDEVGSHFEEEPWLRRQQSDL